MTVLVIDIRVYRFIACDKESFIEVHPVYFIPFLTVVVVVDRRVANSSKPYPHCPHVRIDL